MKKNVCINVITQQHALIDRLLWNDYLLFTVTTQFLPHILLPFAVCSSLDLFSIRDNLCISWQRKCQRVSTDTLRLLRDQFCAMLAMLFFEIPVQVRRIPFPAVNRYLWKTNLYLSRSQDVFAFLFQILFLEALSNVTTRLTKLRETRSNFSPLPSIQCKKYRNVFWAAVRRLLNFYSSCTAHLLYWFRHLAFKWKRSNG